MRDGGRQEQKIGASSSRESHAWRVSTALANKSVQKLEESFAKVTTHYEAIYYAGKERGRRWTMDSSVTIRKTIKFSRSAHDLTDFWE